MKIFKIIVIVMAIVLAAGVGFYLCSDAKETEKLEAAVMI